MSGWRWAGTAAVWSLVALFGLAAGQCAVHAGPYIELGAQKNLQPYNFHITHQGVDQSNDWYGVAEIGLRGNMARWAYVDLYAQHVSSVENDRDGGINWGGVKLGFEWR